MPAVVEFSALAAADLKTALLWYEVQRVGLGVELEKEVERALRSVQSHPHLGVAVGGEVRRLLLRRFPYELLYAVEAERLLILSIRHQRSGRA